MSDPLIRLYFHCREVTLSPALQLQESNSFIANPKRNHCKGLVLSLKGELSKADLLVGLLGGRQGMACPDTPVSREKRQIGIKMAKKDIPAQSFQVRIVLKDGNELTSVILRARNHFEPGGFPWPTHGSAAALFVTFLQPDFKDITTGKAHQHI